eukprot:1568653-Rhodomonas_salina.1
MPSLLLPAGHCGLPSDEPGLSGAEGAEVLLHSSASDTAGRWVFNPAPPMESVPLPCSILSHQDQSLGSQWDAGFAKAADGSR